MAKLSDLFIRISGDDRAFNRTADKVRRSLTDIDRTTVEPNISVPDKPVADIDALQKRLAGLAKQRIALNVSSTLASAEVKTLERQLEDLQTARHAIPVELQGKVNAQILQVQRDLEAAERKQTRIPLTLQRVDAQVAAVRAKLDTLQADVEVPVALTGLAKLRAEMARIRDEKVGIKVDLLVAGRAGGGTPDLPGLLKVPALIAAANAAGTAFASVGAAAVQLGGAIIPAAGAFAALPVALLAVKQATGVTTLALSGVTDVMKLQSDMAEKVASGAKISAEEQAAYNAQLKAAGPAVVTFATQLSKAQTGFAGVRRGVQNALLPQLGRSLAELSGTYLPMLQTQLTGTATVLAGVARGFTAWAMFPSTVTKFNAVLSGNNRLLGSLGVVAQNAADILLNLWVAALPMTIRFGEWLAKVSVTLSNLVERAGRSGALVDFFTKAYNTAAQLGRILGGLVTGLYRVFSGGANEGRRLLDVFESLTDRFAAWTGTLTGRNAIQSFFARAQPVINEVGKLIASVASAFAGLATQSELAPVIAQVRTQLLPALLSIVTATDSKLLPALVGLATQSAKFFNVLSGHGGTLTITIGILTKFAEAALFLLDNIPGATTALGAFFAIMAVNQATSLIATTLGMRGLIAGALGLTTATGPLATAILTLASAEGRATVQTNLLAIAQKVGAAASKVFALSARVVGVAVRFMLGPVGLVITAIGLLVAGFIYAYKHSETFRAIVDKVGAALKGTFLAAVDGVRAAIDWLGKAWNGAASSTGTAWGKIKTAVQTGWQAVLTFLSGIGAAVSAPFVAAWNVAKAITTTVLTAVVGVIKAALGLWLKVIKVELAIIGTVVLLAWQAIKLVVSKAMDGVKVIIAAVWKLIGPIVTKALDNIKANVKAAWRLITDTTTTAWNAIKAFISKVWGGITTVFRDAMRKVREAFSTWWTNLSTRATAAFNAIKTFLSNTWKSIKDSVFGDAMRKVREAFSTWWTNLSSKATEKFGAIKTNIGDTWGGIKRSFTDSQRSVREKWSVHWDTMKRTGSDAMGSIKRRISDVFGQIKTGTRDFVSRMGELFSGIKNAFSAPWEWVQRNVFSKIASAYNKVAKLVGAPMLNLANGGGVGGQVGQSSNKGRVIPVANADGGKIRGVGGPRQDNIAGIDRRTGVQTSWVSAREFVVNAKSTAANEPLVRMINDAHGPLKPDDIAKRLFADGGLVPGLFMGGATPHPGPYSSHGLPYYGARIAGDFGSGYGGKPPIRAWKAGTVAAVQRLGYSYGHNVRINHGGEWTRYAHMSRIGVSAGDRVARNQVIGNAGWTGNVRPRGPGGAHTHFEVHGGSSSTNNGKGDPSGDSSSNAMKAIAPRNLFRLAANKVLDLVGSGLSKVGVDKNTDVKRVFGRLPYKAVDLLASKLPESYNVPGFGELAAGAMKALGRGRGAIKSAMQRLGADSVGTYPGHQPNMFRAWDAMISSKATGDRIAGHLAANREKYGIDYLIWNRRMLRSYDKGNIRAGTWAPYFDGQSSNPNRAHTNHVHASFADGGKIGGLAEGGIVRGGRGGVTAHIGEGRFDELVTPLPRNFSGRSDTLERIAALLENRPAGDVHFDFTTYYPLPESESVLMNKALQKVASLGLVG